MKKYFWLLILLSPFLIAASIQQWHLRVIGQYNAAGGATSDPCSGGSPGDPGDDLCESFEGAETPTNGEIGATDSGWTEIETEGTVDMRQSHPGTFSCTKRGTYATNIYSASGNNRAGLEYPATTFGGSDSAYYEISVYVTSVEAGQTGLAFIGRRGGSTRFSLQYKEASSVYTWVLTHEDIGDNGETDDGSTFSTGTWYIHRIWWDSGGSSGCGTEGVGDDDCVQWWISENGANFVEQAISDDSTKAYSLNELSIGNCWWVGPDFNIHVDNLIIDDDTYPGGAESTPLCN